MEDSKIYARLIVNHTSILLIVLLAMHLVYHLASALMGQQMLLNTILFNHGFDAEPRIGTWRNNFSAIVYTYAVGPLVCLFIAALAKMAHSLYYHKQPGDFRIFLYWTYLVGVNYFLGGTLVGLVFSKGFGHAILYGSRMAVPWRIGCVFASMLFLIIIGARSLRYFLESSPNEDLVVMDNKNSRLSYLFCVVALPWIFSTIAMVLFMLPTPNAIWVFLLFTILLILFPVLSFFKFNVRFFLKPEPIQIRFEWGYVVAALGLFVLERILLNDGIKFSANM